jgi:hypothetical protein
LIRARESFDRWLASFQLVGTQTAVLALNVVVPVLVTGIKPFANVERAER